MTPQTRRLACGLGGLTTLTGGIAMDLKKTRVAVLVEQQYQEMEVWYPIYRLRDAGCTVTLVGPEAGTTYPSKLGYPAKSDRAARDVNPGDFDVIVIPGGFAPDFLRRDQATLRLVRGGNVITSRKPDDLPAFVRTILQAVQETQ